MIAKIAPLFVLLMVMAMLAIGVMRLFFDVPFRGSMLLVVLSAALCILCGIGIGTFIATFTKSAQQAQLTAFFVNPPLTTLSGSLTPVEAMPSWLQPVTLAQPDPPLRHHRARHVAEGQRPRRSLAEFSGADRLHRGAGVAQHLAFPETTWMSKQMIITRNCAVLWFALGALLQAQAPPPQARRRCSCRCPDAAGRAAR